MTQEQLESILRQLQDYQNSLASSDRDKQELMDIIIEQFKDDMPSWGDDNISLEGIFEEIVEELSEADSSFCHESHRLTEKLINHIEIEE